MAIPLNELLSDALAAFTREVGDVPLGVYANLLRLVPDDGLPLRDVPVLARVSKRAAQYDSVIARRFGWATLVDKRVRLTTAGRSLSDECAKHIGAAEAAWRDRVGDVRFGKLRGSLEKLVTQFDLELPHYPVSYGPADGSVTGGVMMRWGRGHALRAKGLPGHVFDPNAEHEGAEAWEAESGGRLYVRGTGQDWRPVVRDEGDTVSGLPLYALMSQSLMAFAIDYEGCGGLPLALTGNVLSAIGDDGVEIAIRVATAQGKRILVPAAAGLAGLDRHAFGDVTPDPKDRKKGRFTLSEKGRLVRDSYDDIVVAIEDRWKRRYGAALMRSVRSALTSVPPS